MITGELKSKVDRIWDTMWSGGISNPLTVIEQLTYLLFIKRLDELHTLAENKANRTRQADRVDPIFAEDQQHLRWSRFRDQRPREAVRDRSATKSSRSSRRSGESDGDAEDSTYSHPHARRAVRHAVGARARAPSSTSSTRST